ncbi:ABC transporter substrate-binding protein [Paenibacillus sp. 598K]|uniref:ABC transporter substrate-binding protein n=1 Tax=Paenibacillus sp. 598K TaxID=1117987 RepID=UPI000FFEA40C|nr:ABC transporter substrate-binding protein [Paenibacillus sp. 598K]
MKTKSAMWMICLLCLMLALAGCGSQNTAAPAEEPEVSEPADNGGEAAGEEAAAPGEEGINWEERIAANKAVGKITYITGFNYSASAPNINVAAAIEMGLFEELGLNVEIQPGVEAESMKLLAAGRAQFAGAGSASTVIQAIASGGRIEPMSVMSPVGLNALMVLADSGIEELTDLEGKTLGYKAAFPPNFRAMFINAGVDLDKVEMVSVGFDPTILNTSNVDAITVFKSNEPFQMEQKGFKVKLFDPADYGVKNSFGLLNVNKEFAEKNPTVAEDFLRAVLKAHELLMEDATPTIAALEKMAEGNYNLEAETNRWAVESQLIVDSKREGLPLGWATPEQWQAELDILQDAEALSGEVTVDQLNITKYLEAIYDGEELIWKE